MVKHGQRDRLPWRQRVFPCVSVTFFGAIPPRYQARSKQKGLRYAVEGFIPNIKLRNEWDTTTIDANAYQSQEKSEKPHDHAKLPQMQPAQPWRFYKLVQWLIVWSSKYITCAAYWFILPPIQEYTFALTSRLFITTATDCVSCSCWMRFSCLKSN